MEIVRFCFVPWQHLQKTDNITGESVGQGAWGIKQWPHVTHPSISCQISLTSCWRGESLEPLYLPSKGLIPGVCPLALRVEHCEGAVFVWLQGMRRWTLTLPSAASRRPVGCGGYRPHLRGSWHFTQPSPENAPTGRRYLFSSCQESALPASFREGFWCFLSLGQKYNPANPLPALLLLEGSWKAGKHATVRGGDTFWGPRRHFLQVKCGV